MHGGWPQKGRTPCNLVFGSFINAWGMALKGRNPMQSSRRKFHKCMGDGPKRAEPHAIYSSEASKMHGEQPQKGGTPCKVVSGRGRAYVTSDPSPVRNRDTGPSPSPFNLHPQTQSTIVHCTRHSPLGLLSSPARHRFHF